MRTLAHYVTAYRGAIRVRIDDYVTGRAYAITHPDAAALLLNLDARDDIWLGYAEPDDPPGTRRGFDAPDLPTRYVFSFNDKTGRSITVTEQDGIAYLYAFTSNAAFADRRGAHYGKHPKRAFRLPSGVVEAVVTRIGSMIGVDKYPPLAEPDDVRWKRRGVKPLAAVVNLRCVPSTLGNDAIARLTTPLREAWVVPDAYVSGDEAWAQMKYGNSVVWVSQEWIAFT